MHEFETSDARRHTCPTMPDATIRAVTTADANTVKSIAVESGLFAPDELDGFEEILSGYLDGSLEEHRWIVWEKDGVVGGAAYVAPEPFSDRVWNLYFLGVLPDRQGTGVGGALVRRVEGDLRDLGETKARVLVVETSSVDSFARTRAFYERLGFEREARIREYYGPGNDKIVYWKSLAVPLES